MKRLVCLAVGIMLLFSAAVAEEHTSDELLGFGLGLDIKQRKQRQRHQQPIRLP